MRCLLLPEWMNADLRAGADYETWHPLIRAGLLTSLVSARHGVLRVTEPLKAATEEVGGHDADGGGDDLPGLH